MYQNSFEMSWVLVLELEVVNFMYIDICEEKSMHARNSFKKRLKR